MTVIKLPLTGQVPAGNYVVSLELTDAGTGATATLDDIEVQVGG